MINLVENTITTGQISKLCKWLKTDPQLTKNGVTEKFEHIWGIKNNITYSVYVNSGSSANLLMFYAASLYKEKKRNKNVIVPAVSWSTTVTPLLQLGYNPIFCDCKLDNGLSIDPEHFKKLAKKYKPWAAIIVNPLGFIGDMEDIITTCEDYNIFFMEDSCETVGSTYNGEKAGNFGEMSSFSFYYGHHFSTIEGGMVCTDDKKLYKLLLMLRSHGWDRDLDIESKQNLRTVHNLDEFKSLYSFYVPGFNLRATDLQAFIGLEQMKLYEKVNAKRFENYKLYKENLKPGKYPVTPFKRNKIVSNFAYPVISENAKEIVKALTGYNIATRPLICGSMTTQPMMKKFKIANTNCSVAEDIVDKYGLYLPNHSYLKKRYIKNMRHC